MHKHTLIAGFAVALAMVPAFAFAQSTNVQSQIQALLAQIQSLQQQIQALIASSTSEHWTNGSSTPWMNGTSTPSGMPPGLEGKSACISLNRDLEVGSEGSDVSELQTFLGGVPGLGFTASSTGFFGPITAHAMMKFQMMNGIASSTNGSVGPLTRGFFQRKCGEGIGNGNANSDHGNGQGDVNGSGQGNEGDHNGPPSWGNSSSTPSWMDGSSTPPVAGPGEHCGGFIQNAPQCSQGYHCQLGNIPDTGGMCVANASSTHSNGQGQGNDH